MWESVSVHVAWHACILPLGLNITRIIPEDCFSELQAQAKSKQPHILILYEKLEFKQVFMKKHFNVYP